MKTLEDNVVNFLNNLNSLKIKLFKKCNSVIDFAFKKFLFTKTETLFDLQK
jgi:hypothetical protein